MNKLKSIGKVLAIMLIATVIMISINPTVAYAKKAKEIMITVDGKQLKTDVAPIVKNGRTLVPFRAIFEGLGSDDITWHQKEQRVEAKIDDTVINLKIGNSTATVNGKAYKLDTAPIVKKGRTLVPIRFVAESTGKYDVDWVHKDRLVKITTKNGVSAPGKEAPVSKKAKIFNDKLNKGFSIGDKEDKVIKDFGQPARKDKSEYGFTWYIYNQDLRNYFQVGVKDGKIVAFGTNSIGWKYEDYKIGQVHKNLVDEPVYIIDGIDTVVDIYADIHESYRVSSIMAMDRDLMFAETTYTPEVLEAMALQLHDLTNVYRVRAGRNALDRDDSLVRLAKYHANDMATNDFFSHTSSDGRNLGQRAVDFLDFNSVAENISQNSDAVASASSLYNSKGHRNNMMRNCQALGVAVDYGNSRNVPLFVQNFKVR